ncbi:MAG: serine/threonine protein kinase [Candidatus Obscuribacterales bacterium]|nr:serine/threonine protein kinase [Candidatus Obscuribacterales bacterium]
MSAKQYEMGGDNLSIFEQDLKFEPLTARRRRLLKFEIISYLTILAVVGFVAWFNFNQAHAIIKPFLVNFQSLLIFLKSTFSPIFDQFTQTIDALVGNNQLHATFQHVWLILKGIQSLILNTVKIFLQLTPLIFLIAYHNGIFQTSKRTAYRSVLSEELRKWWILNLGPSVKLTFVQKRSVLAEIFATVLVLLLSCSLAFLIWSGFAKEVTPGYILRSLDLGMCGWMFACLREAGFQVPADWLSYLTAEKNLLAPLHKATQWTQFYEMLLDFQHSFIPPAPVMPSELVNFRTFSAALCTLMSAVPASLALHSAGLDRLDTKKLVLSPMYIVVKTRLSYERKVAWSDVTSLTEKEENIIVLFSKGNESIRINTSDLKEEDRRTLFQAIDELATGCSMSEDIRDKYFSSTNRTSSTYTLFWEDALASTRKSTVFVPLKESDELLGGKIVVQRQLAGQGWSATYLARYRDSAVVLRESYISSESKQAVKAAEMLEREARILLTLNHPSIAKVTDSFIENGRSYLVLEYIPGRDLRQHLKFSGALPEGTVVNWALQICTILEYLHGQESPVIHRDLSPDNLLLTEQGNIRLIDFGASKQSIENATGTLIGKRAFMAPEQLRGKASIKSDIYAFGATLHCLLTGKEPIALAQSHPQKQIPGITDELDRLVSEMTSFETSHRPNSISEIRARLEQLQVVKQPAAAISLAKKIVQICKIASTSTLEEEAACE